MKTLKEFYNLQYDNSRFNSGLILWYNKLIDRTYDELNVADVTKMYRQEILTDVAMSKAVDLFHINAYDGEYYDGGLLELILLFDFDKLKINELSKIKVTLELTKDEYKEFDWLCDEDIYTFKINIVKLENRLL